MTQSNQPTTPQPRPYQSRCLDELAEAQRTHRSVCIVAPTGAGKTVLASEIIRRSPHSVLFLVHRRELVHQTFERFAREHDTAVIAPGYPLDTKARVQIATIQTLLAREHRPDVGLLILDEAHHYRADAWQTVVAHYGHLPTVGLTATPERQDGSPLGDIFDHLIVAAHYRELIADAHLVEAHVYAPEEAPRGDGESSGLAQHPLLAWQSLAPGTQTFLFAARVEHAHRFAEEFNSAGIPAGTIEASTPAEDRQRLLDRFKRHDLRVLCNVNVLTEGVDVPSAQTCILAKNFHHVSAYLQTVGRVLRPAPGKAHAIVIDLTGATLRHGMPTEDRRYALTGEAIQRTTVVALRNCQQCGCVYPTWQGECPQCGFAPPPKPLKLRIFDRNLALVYAGADTPDEAKHREWTRVRELARAKNWSLSWAIREYEKLFASLPPLTDDEKRACYEGWRSLAAKKGFKPGFAKVMYKNKFGDWPPRHWGR
jgi:superfamily II DNA or RNA helicase